MNYYNDIEPYVCQWLENLIAGGELANGIVDRRSIKEIGDVEFGQFQRCHFFAGIGGWELALKLAGWPDDQRVWTGSCPCQPFSVAGKRKGTEDERHLWPVWFDLIRAFKPPVIFGEQVPNAIGHGWLDGVFADLEGEGYSCGAAVLGAHSVGAPHIRQRLYWLALTERYLSEPRRASNQSTESVGASSTGASTELGRRRDVSGLGDSAESRSFSGAYGGLHSGEEGAGSRDGESERSSFWLNSELIPCLDGKARRIEPGTFPLAHGVPARVGKLRAYGNAIVPQVAAAFIRAAMEVINDGV